MTHHQNDPRLGRIRPLALLGVALLMLSGCASMSEKECLSANWFEQGLEDGREGAERERLQDHAKACGKLGIVPDRARWQEGWSEGIRVYCRPENGWRLGLAGEYYRGSCGGQRDGDLFERNYTQAKHIHELGQQIDRNYREMQRLERALAEAKTDEDRKHLRGLLRELDLEQQRLRTRQQMELLSAPRP